MTYVYGPRVRFASVLHSEMVHETAKPITESECGSCNLCVDKCPPDAATGALWNTFTHRDEFYDWQQCRTYCRAISKEKLGREISLCGLCVAVCPAGEG